MNKNLAVILANFSEPKIDFNTVSFDDLYNGLKANEEYHTGKKISKALLSKFKVEYTEKHEPSLKKESLSRLTYEKADQKLAQAQENKAMTEQGPYKTTMLVYYLHHYNMGNRFPSSEKRENILTEIQDILQPFLTPPKESEPAKKKNFIQRLIS